jgi:dienelactone hydrolase
MCVVVKKLYQTVLEERALPNGLRTRLDFRADGGEAIPAILLLARSATPAPAAVLLHGYSSRKERMADTIGAGLLDRGIASLAIDLPLHGDRERGDREREDDETLALRSPFALLRRWRAALDDTALALRYLGAHTRVDPGRLALVGYSLGAFLAVTVAARERVVRALVLAAGGDLPDGSPLTGLVRPIVDPVRAVKQLAGRPLLMMHGRWDRTVRPEQAERLFAAAEEPKTIRWWDAGHILPAAAIADAAGWLVDALDARRGGREEEAAGRG